MKDFSQSSMETGLASASLSTFSEKLRNVQTSSLPFIALALSACGSGGGGGSSVSTLDGSNSNTTNGNTGGTTVSAGGSGGGGITLPPSGNNLSLYRVGSDYVSTSFSGLTLINGEAHFQVSDAASNNYAVKMSAEGAGLLKFEFSDANDVITLLDGSVVSGFSQMKVINGTVDATNADLGLINYISVASSVKLTASQVSDLDTIVINSSSGGIEIIVASEADINLISNAMSSGNLNIFSPGDLVSYTAAAGANVTQSQLDTAETTANAARQALSAVNVSEISQSQTILAQRSYATLSIQNNDLYINNAESQSTVKFKVDVADGYSVTSVRVGNVALQGANGEYSLNVGSSGLGNGTHQVTVELADAALAALNPSLGYTQSTISLISEIVIDTVSPGDPVILIDGESNAINAFEAAQQLEVSVLTSADEEVSSISVNGVALAQSGDNYLLNAQGLADGTYTVDLVVTDRAGNLSSSSKSFTVDADALQEATVSVVGGDLMLNASEASGNISLNIALNGAANLVSAELGGVSLSAAANGTYSVNAANLSEGTHTITVVSQDASGAQITSQTELVVDRTDPSAPNVSIFNGSGGLTAAERVDPVNVVVVPEAGGSVIDVKLDGSSVSSIAEGVYEFAAGGLSSGFHTLSITSQDAAGNQATVNQEVMIVGSTTSGADIFEFQTTKLGDVITFEAFVKNSHVNLPDGIPSFDFWIDLTDTQLDYVEGSFDGAPGATYLTTENGTKGEIFGTGFFLTPWNQYEEAFFSFQARETSTFANHTISFKDFVFYTTDIGDFIVSVDV